MDLRYIRGADWVAFEARFHDAYLFLLAASLRGERETLEREAAGYARYPDSWTPERKAWVRNRITELTRNETDPL